MAKQQNKNIEQPENISADVELDSIPEVEPNFNEESQTEDSKIHEVIAEKPMPTKVILKEKYKFEVPVVGRPDVYITVNFKEKQEVTDSHTIKHLMDANAPISFEI